MAKVTSKAKPKAKAAAAETTVKSKSAPKKEKTKSSTKMQTLLMLVLVVVVLQFLLVLSLVINQGTSSDARIANIEEKVDALDQFFTTYVPEYTSPSGSGQAQQGFGSEPAAPTDLVADIEGEPFLGDVDAPVVVVEFSEYECPFCKRFYDESYEQLKTNYVDTGLVKLVFKDFPLTFHPNAEPAAVAANCVQEQLGNEAYFAFHDQIFENQNSLNEANYIAWATEIGVDVEAFETCLDDPAQAQEVQGDFAEGLLLGVSGTPSFIINGELVVGAQPYSVLAATIDAKLAEN